MVTQQTGSGVQRGFQEKWLCEEGWNSRYPWTKHVVLSCSLGDSRQCEVFLLASERPCETGGFQSTAAQTPPPHIHRHPHVYAFMDWYIGVQDTPRAI